VALLDCGLKTAHCAYTQSALEQAQVVADTPAYADYPLLDQHYPDSKFIYLDREFELWHTSFIFLYRQMLGLGFGAQNSRFHPRVEQSYFKVFGPTSNKLFDPIYLSSCYNQHKTAIEQYFKNRADDLLQLNLSQTDSYYQMMDFLGLERKPCDFPHLNSKRVTDWTRIQSRLKVDSNAGSDDTSL